MAKSYCVDVRDQEKRGGAYAPLHRRYHDRVHGRFPRNDQACFARMVMEQHQAGLNWGLVLKKEQALRRAFCDFNPTLVARFTEKRIATLKQDTSIIRSDIKIRAAVKNATAILTIQSEYGTFRKWLLAHHPQSLQNWTRLLKQRFAFIGPEITSEFLMGMGLLPGAHHPSCKIGQSIKNKLLKK